MERNLNFVVGEYYHIYNRGINKNKIFFEKGDQKHFQRLLYTRNTHDRIDSTRVKGVPLHKIPRGGTLVNIVAYALMSNHFHILIEEKQEGGISKFMGKLGTAYSMYVNTKYSRSGPLMCRPFRSKHIDSDEYFRWVISYIHINPSELSGDISVTDFLAKYPFSSYVDYYKSPREETLLLEKKSLPFPATQLESIETMTKILHEEENLI